ncbi:MHC class I polypeptide-related sequence A-like [Engraulis encrasicolus]|uniref:MHC class I polypeptide-related sequence A-like n=1 Tax=Engraulis encrasicolus TaxID=184585 RepID=UPI002FD4EB7E
MFSVKPRVRLLQKALPDTGGVRVTCLATGFYPRHINLTLLRDGQPVAEQQISGGELLPNGDGSYQMRKSLEVSTEELQHHQYTCTAQHLSLDNKMDIPLGPRLLRLIHMRRAHILPMDKAEGQEPTPPSQDGDQLVTVAGGGGIRAG